MSVVVSPFLAKPLMRLSRLEPGGGRSLLACERLAVVESLLPNSTVYGGPPNCKQRKEAEYINIIRSRSVLLVLSVDNIEIYAHISFII